MKVYCWGGLRLMPLAYLLGLRSRVNNVIHQHWHKFGHSVYASGEGAILGRAVYDLAFRLGQFQPLARYRVYDVEHS